MRSFVILSIPEQTVASNRWSDSALSGQTFLSTFCRLHATSNVTLFSSNTWLSQKADWTHLKLNARRTTQKRFNGKGDTLPPIFKKKQKPIYHYWLSNFGAWMPFRKFPIKIHTYMLYVCTYMLCIHTHTYMLYVCTYMLCIHTHTYMLYVCTYMLCIHTRTYGETELQILLIYGMTLCVLMLTVCFHFNWII